MDREKILHYSRESHSQKLMADLDEMRKSSLLTDVILRVDGILIPCHKAVLSAACDFFCVMFSSGFKERCSSKVDIKGCNALALSAIVDYFYTGKVDISLANVQSLIEGSFFFELTALKDACIHFAVEQIDAHSCIDFLRFGKLFSINTIIWKAQEKMREDFETVVSGRDFLGLTEAELLDYISDESVEVEEENIVFEALVGWTHAKLNERRGSFHKIISQVRLEHCTPSFLSNIVQKEPLMADPWCKQLVKDARCYQSKVRTESNAACPKFQPRSVKRSDAVLIASKEGSSELACWAMGKDRSFQHFLTKLPNQSVSSFSACMTSAGFFVSGGITQGSPKSDCWLFQKEGQMWISLPPMANARQMHGSAFHDDSVYVVGGCIHRDQEALRYVESFELKRLRWQWRPSLNAGLIEPLVVSCEDDLFVLGGTGPPNTFVLFDEDIQGWKRLADIPLKTSEALVAASIRDKIYVLSRKCCLSFQPSTNQWTSLSQPKCTVQRNMAIAWRGKILIGQVGRSLRLAEYNPVTDSWSVSDIKLPLNPWGCSYLI